MIEDQQAKSKAWWQAHPMSYDWHATIAAKEGTLEFFQEIDKRFFNSSPFYLGGNPFENLIPFAALRGKHVLEIGCGMGAHAQLLAEAGCQLTCIDLTERAIDRTRERLALKGLIARLQVMDAEKLGFADSEFDFVWSWGVIHHSTDTPAIVREVHRVLKSGGEFRVMVYNRSSLLARAFLVRGLLTGKLLRGMTAADVLNHYSDGYTARHFKKRELYQLLKESGFRNIRLSLLGQKSELIPLPSWGPVGQLKATLLAKLPDGLARRLLSIVGHFLFGVAKRD